MAGGWNGAKRAALTAGFCGFFLLGFFFLFLGLELVADQFEDRYLGAVADANARRDDSCVAAGAVRELWRDLAEELLRNARSHDVGSRLPPRLQRVALPQGDHLLCHWPRGLGAR